MSNPSGIFDSFSAPSSVPSPFAAAPESPATSPFAAAPEPAHASPFAPAYDSSQASPFAAARSESPFSAASDTAGARPLEPGKPARLPEKRKPESPFQLVDAKEGFGLDQGAAPPGSNGSPFGMAPSPSPFGFEPTPLPAQSPAPFPAQPAPAWQPPVHPSFPVQSPYGAAPDYSSSRPAGFDSTNIRQLELRAIFGVDREMTADEILQRARALPGVRHIARVLPQDMGTIESLKNTISNLGFGNGQLRVYAGSVPLEFIREGQVMLAVQTDGGFAPGVRETLMIVSRELGRIG